MVGVRFIEIDNIENAMAIAQGRAAYGAWSLKSYNQPCRSARQQLLQVARELDMDVVPEGGMNFFWNVNQIIDGHTTIEHSLPVAPLYDDVTTLFALSGTAYTPTLVVNYGGLFGENYWYAFENVWQEQKIMNFARQLDVMSRSMRRLTAFAPDDWHHFATAQSVVDIFRKGGIVQAGAHGQLQGLGFHWELGMFEQGGLSPIEVLQVGTINGARALGIDNQIGSIVKGKLADLLVYDASSSPLDSVVNTRNMKWVIKDGRVYDAETLNQVYPQSVPLPTLPIINVPHV